MTTMLTKALIDDRDESGVEAYTYFHPLVLMDTTRRQAVNVETGKVLGRRPMNVFTDVRASRCPCGLRRPSEAYQATRKGSAAFFVCDEIDTARGAKEQQIRQTYLRATPGPTAATSYSFVTREHPPSAQFERILRSLSSMFVATPVST
jgi:hypothetical protein